MTHLLRSDLDRIGLTRTELKGALACCLVRVRRGIYTIRPKCDDPIHARFLQLTPASHDPAGDLQDIDRRGLRGHAAKLRILARSYQDQLSDGAALSHISAALLWGLPLTDSTVQNRVEIIRRGQSRTYSKSLVRNRELHSSDTTEIDGIPVTSLLRTLVDVSRDYPLHVSVPMFDHALRVKLVTASELQVACRASHRQRGTARLRTAITLGEATRESPAESVCAVRFHEHRITGFVPQVNLGSTEDGFIARVDFLHRDAWVIVEVNGEIKYTDKVKGAARAKHERKQDTRLRNIGYTVFQLSWNDLFTAWSFHEIKRAIHSRTKSQQG